MTREESIIKAFKNEFLDNWENELRDFEHLGTGWYEAIKLAIGLYTSDLREESESRQSVIGWYKEVDIHQRKHIEKLEKENEELKWQVTHEQANVDLEKYTTNLQQRIEELEKENGLLKDNLTDLYYKENKQ